MSSSSRSMVSCPVCSVKHLPRHGSLQDGVYAFNCESCGHFIKFKATEDVKCNITFTINGKQYTVGKEYNPATSLNEFMRQNGISTGTKACCYEGGCGVCLVSVELFEPISETKMAYSVNSCLLQLYTCDGMNITTIEGLGSPRTKLHPVQERLSKYNGAQCGFCSPGQVMNMYALLKKNPKPTMQEIEDEFDATICRCTGYRSILDAMKSFASDAPPPLKGGTIDIEELDGQLCRKSGKACTGHCSKVKGEDCGNRVSRSVHVVSDGAQWFKPTTFDQLLKLVDQYKTQKYRLVFGNTGSGVFKEISPRNYDILIDLRGIQEMYGIDFDPVIVLGANLSISNLIDIFTRTQTEPSTLYAIEFAKHLKQVAMNGIRNMACWAGNVMLKHKHPEFASDICTLIETIGGKISVVDSKGNENDYSLQDFLALDMTDKVVLAMALPTFESKNLHVRTFRTALRLQACHSYVVSGFMFDLDATKNYTVTKRPSIVIQGISTKLIHATKTEDFLTNKQLGDPAVLKQAFSILSQEIVPESYPVAADPKYRKNLALSMFYKFVLGACKTKVDPRYLSGGSGLDRALIVGSQDYGTDPSEYPVSKPIGKITEDYLTTGSVKFVMDQPAQPGQLSAVIVTTTVAQAKIASIDCSAALKFPGVAACLTAKDIPGKNSWRPAGIFGDFTEELLCSGTVNFAGQPVVIVVADKESTAHAAAKLVKVSYENVQTPVLDIKEAIAKKRFFPNPPEPTVMGDAKGAIAAAPLKVTGSIACGYQYQFHLENQTALATPTDLGGMNVKATSQWIDGVLETVAEVCGIAQSDVTVEIQRLGGAFGGKITQNFLVSGLSAVAAYVLNRPVMLHLDIHTNMEMLGKRTPYLANYEVGVDLNGKLLGVQIDLFGDSGWNFTPAESDIGANIWFDNAYNCPNWLWTPVAVKTDKPINTACRSPGSLQFIFIMESIMEDVAKTLRKDPLDVRKENLYVKGQTTPSGLVLEYCSIRQVVAQLETDIKLQQRKQDVEAFNQANRWKKRGLSVMPNRFEIANAGAQYNCSVVVYHGDASVVVAHGGIDMGQGINTKVIQVCAFELGIPMDDIRVATSSTLINGNSITSGGSITSETCCAGVIECCKVLKERMAPVKAKMVNPSWKDLVNKCYEEMIDLTVSYMTHPPNNDSSLYNCYSAACVEAELDVLTGQYQLRQLDMLYDCGQSMNPELDIGQAEGGFIFGLGYFLTEQMKYDPSSGKALTNTTWEYKPPMPKDLPMNFNFKFLRNAPNPRGTLRSKAVGEPPLTMAAAALFAIKHCVEAARAEIGQDVFFTLDAPATVEKVQGLCLNSCDNYTFGKS